MASVLILSKQGDGVPIALRLSQEGHIVKVYIHDDHAKDSLKGYRNPSQISNPMKMIEQYDLVLCDMAGLGSMAKQCQDRGKLVLGGGVFNDNLELSRDYGERIAKTLLPEAKIPQSKLFSDLDSCITYLKDLGSPAVIKPNGNKKSQYTLISDRSDNRVIIDLMYSHGKDLLPVLVQNKIEGIEVSTEGWFNGEGFSYYNHTLEVKRLLDKDHGPVCGCTGNVVWLSEEGGDKLTETLLNPLIPLLKKVNYLGPMDVNAIVNEEGAWFLEFTPRFGYEAIQTLTELIRGSLFDFLYSTATNGPKIHLIPEYAIGVRLSMPPYPYEEGLKALKGVQVLDIPSGARNHIHLADVMLEENREVLAGVDGVVGCVTARGENIKECQRRVYRTIKNITATQDLQYRSDIGTGFEDKIQILKEMKWV